MAEKGLACQMEAVPLAIMMEVPAFALSSERVRPCTMMEVTAFAVVLAPAQVVFTTAAMVHVRLSAHALPDATMGALVLVIFLELVQ